MMKRYIEIKGHFDFVSIEEEWELTLKVTFEDIIPLFMELQLLEYKHSDAFVMKSRNSASAISISLIEKATDSRIRKKDEKYDVELTLNDLEMLSSFILKYYRDSCAPVSHIHIDVAKNDALGNSGGFTIVATEYAPPMSGEEARKLLGMD